MLSPCPLDAQIDYQEKLKSMGKPLKQLFPFERGS